MGTVYIITNTENDKVYIGSTEQPIHRRMNEHRSRAKRNKRYALYDEMRRVGIEKFSIAALVEDVPAADLHRVELDEIKGFPDKTRLLNTALGISFADIEYIVQEYKAGKRVKQIAKERHHCSKSVSAVLRAEGIEVLDWNDFQRVKISESDLRRLYVDEMKTTPEIAEICGTSHQTILKHLRKHGIELRRAVNRKYLMPRPSETEG